LSSFDYRDVIIVTHDIDHEPEEEDYDALFNKIADEMASRGYIQMTYDPETENLYLIDDEGLTWVFTVKYGYDPENNILLALVVGPIEVYGMPVSP
jgi:hypothetical protein